MIEQKKGISLHLVYGRERARDVRTSEPSLGCVAASCHSSSWRERLAQGFPEIPFAETGSQVCGAVSIAEKWGGSRFLSCARRAAYTPAWRSSKTFSACSHQGILGMSHAVLCHGARLFGQVLPPFVLEEGGLMIVDVHRNAQAE